MTSTMNSVALLGCLAALISGCAVLNPGPPSLPPNQFVVLVKGEPGPLKTFSDFVQGQMESRKLPGCEKKVPSSVGETRITPVEGQLVYQCAAPTRTDSGSLLAIFATAYGNSIASLLEMKITTSGACVAKRCWGGPFRYWQETPPCTYLC
jgi:hypothetical protein